MFSFSPSPQRTDVNVISAEVFKIGTPFSFLILFFKKVFDSLLLYSPDDKKPATCSLLVGEKGEKGEKNRSHGALLGKFTLSTGSIEKGERFQIYPGEFFF